MTYVKKLFVVAMTLGFSVGSMTTTSLADSVSTDAGHDNGGGASLVVDNKQAVSYLGLAQAENALINRPNVCFKVVDGNMLQGPMTPAQNWLIVR